MTSNSEIRFYYETMIVETILSDAGITKKADNILSSLIETVKGYVSNHINPEDRMGSVLDLLAPGAVSVLFSSMGFGGLGLLFGGLVKYFNIDVKNILSSIYNGVKSLISGNKQVTSGQIDGLVNSTVQSHSDENTSNVTQLQTASIQEELKDAKMLKLALISYEKQIIGLEKNATFIVLASRKGKTLNVLGRVLSWIFKIILASAGFMVAGDAVNKLLDRPNAFDGSIKDGKPVEQANEAPVPTSKQTKFPLNPGFVDTRYNFGNNNWIEKINNNKSNIESMLIRFTKEVYDGLDSQDASIRRSQAFQDVVEDITWYNHSAVGDPIVFIPKKYASKKQLVDAFIDQIAATPGSPSPTNPQPNLPQGSYLV